MRALIIITIAALCCNCYLAFGKSHSATPTEYISYLVNYNDKGIPISVDTTVSPSDKMIKDLNQILTDAKEYLSLTDNDTIIAFSRKHPLVYLESLIILNKSDTLDIIFDLPLVRDSIRPYKIHHERCYPPRKQKFDFANKTKNYSPEQIYGESLFYSSLYSWNLKPIFQLIECNYDTDFVDATIIARIIIKDSIPIQIESIWFRDPWVWSLCE